MEHDESSVQTVEAVIRGQLATALGGKRGMLEAAVPTIIFTVTFLTLHNLKLALALSLTAAVAALAVRIVQRSSVQFAVNALIGIGLGALFAARAAQAGGSVDEQALAYFLPGILYNAAYAVLLSFSCLIRWPLVGFMVGGVTGDATGWRADRQIVRICSNLTWVLAAPCLVRVLVQGPFYLAATRGVMDDGLVIAILGISKLLMGWPLQLAALAAMVWLLSRDRTPVSPVTR